jgi:outer membrane protein TolC
MIESNLYKFQSSKELSKSAIAHVIGLNWDAPINIVYTDNYEVIKLDRLNQMIDKAKIFNPKAQNMEILLSIDDEIIKEKSSAFYPSVGLTLKAQDIYNSQSTGINTDENKHSWMIGMGIRIPLFDGFLDSAKVLEAKIKKQQNEILKLMVNDAIAMQIKHGLIEYGKSLKEVNLYKKNIDLANENTELNFQGYQIDMIQTSDVIQAQLMESFMQTGYAKALYNYNLSLVTLEKLIGKSIDKQ